METKLLVRSAKPVAIWLLIGVGMIMIQVLLGGITRLTGSGLSITEWKPILGALPPMNEADWLAAYEKYKVIGQYKQINFNFTLSDFKFIYFWEWFHREWARLIGVVFCIGFVYFWFKKYFTKEMARPMLVLFVLGGLQGLIGWIMVDSGVNKESVYVDHFKLAIHFISALVLLCYVLWFALKLMIEKQPVIYPIQLKRTLWFLLLLLTIQLVYGALVAGLKAAVVAPTWPDMNGFFIPLGLSSAVFSDPLTVHFIHRMLAYLLFLSVVFWWFSAKKSKGDLFFRTFRNVPLIIVSIQLVLGILTVLNSTDKHSLILFGVLHQFTAMLLLSSLIVNIYLLGVPRWRLFRLKRN
jgi:cytochrome c oxidase assembly protein subunit 15